MLARIYWPGSIDLIAPWCAVGRTEVGFVSLGPEGGFWLWKDLDRHVLRPAVLLGHLEG